MAETRPAPAFLSCPACFARELDPIPLHRDREDGSYYCTKCSYIAATADEVAAFSDDFIRHRHGIRRQEPV
jgi:hypothetical protein